MYVLRDSSEANRSVTFIWLRLTQSHQFWLDVHDFSQRVLVFELGRPKSRRVNVVEHDLYPCGERVRAPSL